VQPVRYLNNWLRSFSNDCCKENSMAELIDYGLCYNVAFILLYFSRQVMMIISEH
jgi:hypothetical protein